MADERDLVREFAAGFRSGAWPPELTDALRAASGQVAVALGRRYQPADIDDGIAEALLLLAEQPGLFRPEVGSLAGFLYVVARNAAARQARRLTGQVPTDPRQLTETADERGPSLVDPRTRERRVALADELERLPADERDLLAVFAAAGPGEPWASELARRTGDDANRLRVRLHRLLVRLRRALT